MSSPNLEIRIQAGDPPFGICRVSEEKDHKSWKKQEKNDQLFLGIHINGGINHSYAVRAFPCFETIGQARFLFPEDWSHIDPNAPIRAGDCSPKYPEGYAEMNRQEQMQAFENLSLNDWKNKPENFLNFSFCNVKPELDVIIYGITHPKGNV